MTTVKQKRKKLRIPSVALAAARASAIRAMHVVDDAVLQLQRGAKLVDNHGLAEDALLAAYHVERLLTALEKMQVPQERAA